MITEKNNIWNFGNEIDGEQTGPGVVRKILAYADELMVVQNNFEEGAVGALHHHPHTQATYVLSGEFEFEVDGVKKTVRTGDVLLKRNDIVHGCVCTKKGALLDIFTPMREDFIK